MHHLGYVASQQNSTAFQHWPVGQLCLEPNLRLTHTTVALQNGGGVGREVHITDTLRRVEHRLSRWNRHGHINGVWIGSLVGRGAHGGCAGAHRCAPRQP